MENQFRFIAKVVLISILISLLIKYSRTMVTIHPTTTNGLLIVILPTVILGLALVYRKIKNPQVNE